MSTPATHIDLGRPCNLTVWEQTIVNEVADLALCYAKLATDERGHAILLSHSLFMDELQKGIHVAGSAVRIAVPSELVYINFYPNNDVVRDTKIRVAFHRVPLPFIEGVEHYAWQDTPKGVVIVRGELR